MSSLSRRPDTFLGSLPGSAPCRTPILALALIASACARSEESGAAADVDGDSPETVVRAALEDRWADGDCPGTTVAWLSTDGSEVAAVAVGVADRDTGLPMQTGDRMLSGSIGKTYVSAVALQLVAEGTLELDGPLSEWLGDEDWFDRLPNGREITLRDLLRHTTGIPRHIFRPGFLEAVNAEPDRTWQPRELVSYVLDVEPLGPVGREHAYADTNYVLLGMAIEKATGEALYRLVFDRLLEPFDLADTQPSDRRVLPGLVQGHLGEQNAFGAPEHTLLRGVFFLNPQFEWAGGGYYSTVADLARWAFELYRGRAFDTSLWGDFHEGFPMGGSGTIYGLGVMRRNSPYGQTFGHDGTMPGYRSSMRYFVDHELAVAVQSNCDRLVLGQGPDLTELVELVAGVVLGGAAGASPPVD